ncbi:hypothetical protein [Candidatus Fokinia crypta]|uniref:Uncharacterized protein n=1 Tax=Candidatus Fokinia crypta TaxID=1920990 RepID=A0ABZ0UPM5_9RICK|nr:hypothetical protein [Candidatus Fokinia cryptica]WPX98080.1 hypothetical protein Fokcrypt_00610 [Candidatus Fokinia cryptica]
MRRSLPLLFFIFVTSVSISDASVEKYMPKFSNTPNTPANFDRKMCELGLSFFHNGNLSIKADSGIQRNETSSISDTLRNISDISTKSHLNGIGVDLLYLITQTTYNKGKIFIQSGPMLSYFQYYQDKERTNVSEILKDLNFSTLAMQAKLVGTVKLCKYYSIGCFLNGGIGITHTNLSFDLGSRKRISIDTSTEAFSNSKCTTPTTVVNVVNDLSHNLFDMSKVDLYYAYGAGIRAEFSKVILELGFTKFDGEIEVNDEKTYANVTNTSYQIVTTQDVESCEERNITAIAANPDLINIYNPHLQFSDKYLITFRAAYSF